MTILYHGSDRLFDEIDPARLQYVVTSGSVRHSGWGFFTSTSPDTARHFLKAENAKPGKFALYRYEIDDRAFKEHLIVDDQSIGEAHFKNILKTALDHRNKHIFAHLKDMTPTSAGEYLLPMQQGKIKDIRAREASEFLAKAGIYYFYMSRENCIIVLETDALPQATLVELREDPQTAFVVERGSPIDKLTSLGPASADLVKASEALPLHHRKAFLDTANRIVNEISARDGLYDPFQDIHPIKRMGFYTKAMEATPGLDSAVQAFGQELSLIWPNFPVYPAKTGNQPENPTITRISVVSGHATGAF